MRHVPILFLFAVGCGGSGTGPVPTASAEKVDALPGFGVGSYVLHGQYASNAALADNRFTGKYVTVVGQFGRIVSTDDGYELQFDNSHVVDPPLHVVCRFEKNKMTDLAVTAKRYDDVAVRGRCVGMKAVRSAFQGVLVILDDCELVVKPEKFWQP